MSFLNKEQIDAMGFKHIGKNVLLSSKASFYGASRISIGDNTRIDDFCVLSAGDDGIDIGRHVHIAVYSSLIGKGKITVSDYVNISSRVAIYSSNDDYSGEYMTNPTISEEYTNVTHAPVVIEEHVIIGAGSVILPNVVINRGAAIGALSLVNNCCDANSIYVGKPAKKIKKRKLEYLKLCEKFKMNMTQ